MINLIHATISDEEAFLQYPLVLFTSELLEDFKEMLYWYSRFRDLTQIFDNTIVLPIAKWLIISA